MVAPLFWATVALFAAHELDAMRRHEWRVLPLTSFLPDRVGEQIFLWAHVPLFALVAWILARGTAQPAALAFSGFAVAHVGLHWLYRRHPANEFAGVTSWMLIVLPGCAGALHLAAAAGVFGGAA